MLQNVVAISGQSSGQVLAFNLSCRFQIVARFAMRSRVDSLISALPRIKNKTE